MHATAATHTQYYPLASCTGFRPTFREKKKTWGPNIVSFQWIFVSIQVTFSLNITSSRPTKNTTVLKQNLFVREGTPRMLFQLFLLSLGRGAARACKSQVEGAIQVTSRSIWLCIVAEVCVVVLLQIAFVCKMMCRRVTDKLKPQVSVTA